MTAMKRTFRDWGGRPWWFWRRVANRKKRWSPNELESSLLAWWDASSGVTVTGSGVSAWVDRKGGLSLAQATDAARPAYSPTSFNGFAGLTFDGTADYLELASQPFPSGSAASELWVVCSQDALAADTTTRPLFSYGGVNGQVGRLFQRVVTSGTNRVRGVVGDGSAGQQLNDLSVDFTGRHVLRLSVGPTASNLYVDGGTAVNLSVVPATGTTRIRVGASQADTPTGFWNGKIRDIVVTKPLSADDASALQSYLLDRRAL